jgi:hypothetical protein
MPYLATLIGMALMAPRVKRLRRLYFQFGHLIKVPKLSADQIAEALLKDGLIEYVAYGPDKAPISYRETDAMRDIQSKDLDEYITQVLERHFRVKR